VSVDQVDEFAEAAERSTDSAIGFVILANVACLIVPGLEYHVEDRGCLFDFNEDRAGLARSLKSFKLCASCRNLAETAGFVEILDDILNTLRDFRPGRP
jgi:hypothetical protein